jgi:hypothetical protein
MAPRLTIRLDDGEADALAQITALLGCSRTAWVQAAVSTAEQMFANRGWMHPRDWPDGELKTIVLALDIRAHEIDEARRSRRPEG